MLKRGCEKTAKVLSQPLSQLCCQHSSIQHGRTTALAGSLAVLPASLGLLRAVSPTGRALRAPLFPSGKRRLLDSATSSDSATSQKAPLGIKGAHEARALCAEQREVSPMKQEVPQASLRAQWYDHAELRNAVGASRLRGFPIPPSRLTPCHRSTVQHGRLASCAKRTCDVPCFTGVFVPACASLARYSGAAERFALSSPLHPFGASTTTACFRHWRRPSYAPFPFGKKEAFGWCCFMR